MEHYEEFGLLLKRIQQKYPKYKLVIREKSLLFVLLYKLLFMKYWHAHFLDSYVSTIYYNCYMPFGLINTQMGHMYLLRSFRQLEDQLSHRYTYWPLYMSNPFRAYWEYRGYCAFISAQYMYFGHAQKDLIEYLSSIFSDNTYLWMFPIRPIMRRAFLFYAYSKNIPVQ